MVNNQDAVFEILSIQVMKLVGLRGLQLPTRSQYMSATCSSVVV